MLDIHLVMGANARAKLENVVRNLAKRGIAVVQKSGEAARQGRVKRGEGVIRPRSPCATA